MVISEFFCPECDPDHPAAEFGWDSHLYQSPDGRVYVAAYCASHLPHPAPDGPKIEYESCGSYPSEPCLCGRGDSWDQAGAQWWVCRFCGRRWRLDLTAEPALFDPSPPDARLGKPVNGMEMQAWAYEQSARMEPWCVGAKSRWESDGWWDGRPNMDHTSSQIN